MPVSVFCDQAISLIDLGEQFLFNFGIAPVPELNSIGPRRISDVHSNNIPKTIFMSSTPYLHMLAVVEFGTAISDAGD